MKPAALQKLLDGALGYYWLWGSERPNFTTQEPRAGYLEQTDGGITVRLLVDDVAEAFTGAFGEGLPPHGLVGAADGVGVVVLDVIGSPGGSLHFGGSRASTEIYRAQTVIATNGALDLERPLIEEAAIHLHGTRLFDWAGTSAYRSDVRTNPSTRLVESATLELQPGEKDTAAVRGIGELWVTTDWRLGTRTERGIDVDLALEIGLRRRTPGRSRDVLQQLGHLQVLLSALFDGFVRAGAGWAKLPGVDGRGRLWNSVLMRDPSNLQIKSIKRSAMPIADLPTLGGAQALGRWLRLSHQHPRMLAPIINRWRRGLGPAEAQLVENTVALEYWVAAHRRVSQWARQYKLIPLAAARNIGEDFDTFVGGAERWADRLWKTYNDLKHDPNATFDAEEVYLLARSSYLLLLALSLNRIAGSKAPSRGIFRGPQFDQLGQEVRRLLT